jgi:hypothetical protein
MRLHGLCNLNLSVRAALHETLKSDVLDKRFSR